MPLEGGQKPRERGIIWARAPCGSAQEQEGSTKGSPAQTQPAPLIRAQRTSKRHCSHSCLHIWGVLLPPCSLSRGAPACAGGHCPGSSAHVLRAILFLLPHHVETPSGTLAFPSASPHLSSSSTTQPLPSSLSTRLCTAAAHHTLAPARGHRRGPCPKSQMHPLCCLTRLWAWICIQLQKHFNPFPFLGPQS